MGSPGDGSGPDGLKARASPIARGPESQPVEAPWVEIRRLYAEGRLTLEAISVLHDVTPGLIVERAHAEDWPPRINTGSPLRGPNGRFVPLPASPAAPGGVRRADGANGKAGRTPHKTRHTGTPAASRPSERTVSGAELRERVKRLAARNLELMEEHMDATNGKTSTEERERTTRTVGALIKSIEKVTELSPDTHSKGAGAKAAEPTNADATAELRRELAERLFKLWGGPQSGGV